MSNVIRVIAAVVDQHQLTLYKEDGSEHIIKQGDPELRRILELVMPVIQDDGVAEVSLTVETDSSAQEFKDFQKKTNGFVQFFKVMKAEAEKFLSQLGANTDHVAPLILGSVPSNNPAVTGVQVKRRETPAATEAKAKQNAAVDTILANAIPATSPEFTAPIADRHNEKGTLIAEGSETIIAVVDGTVVPGVEKLAGQFEYAAKEGNSTIGMERFLQRLGAVIAQRNHSVADLLKFLERGDLPIADDGSFVAYKILKKNRKTGEGFVDCHSGNVPQKIGSYVHMDHSLVDHNRSNECSNGLHVARRGYIGHFHGDVCTLIKVNPEDVIAVPNYDANKMRVCGYHIIDLIADEDYRKLSRNNAMTDNMAAKIQLGKALAGDHVGILERVKITKGYGGGIQITGMVKKSEAKKAVNAQKTGTKKRVAKAIESKAPVSKPRAAAVDAKAIAKQVTAQKATGGSARQLKARELFELFETATRTVECTAHDVWQAAVNLVTFKKTAKVSWDKLGISLFEAERLEAAAKTEPAFEEEVNEEPIPAPVAKPVKKAVKPVKPVKAEPAKPSAAATDRQAKMRGLYSKGTKAAAVEALTIKKASKKSWEALGLTKAEGETISKLAGK